MIFLILPNWSTFFLPNILLFPISLNITVDLCVFVLIQHVNIHLVHYSYWYWNWPKFTSRSSFKPVSTSMYNDTVGLWVLSFWPKRFSRLTSLFHRSRISHLFRKLSSFKWRMVFKTKSWTLGNLKKNYV